jgi:hypothetical protein
MENKPNTIALFVGEELRERYELNSGYNWDIFPKALVEDMKKLFESKDIKELRVTKYYDDRTE